jgi:hypothetical protein
MAAAIGGVVAIAPVAAGAARSPAATQRAVIAAARAKGSAHYVSHQSLGGATVTQVADVAADRGIQRITFTANGRTGHVTVVVVNGAVYVRGDAFTLRSYQGFTASEAQSDAGVWVLIPESSRLYRATAADVTTTTFVDDLQLGGRLAAAGRNALSGTASGGVPGTLSYAAGLPVKEVVRPTSGGSASVVMSRWGEPVNITAPKAAKTLAPVVTA